MKQIFLITLFMFCRLCLYSSTTDDFLAVEMRASSVDGSTLQGPSPRMPSQDFYIYVSSSAILVDASLEHYSLKIVRSSDGVTVYSKVVDDGATCLSLPILSKERYIIRLYTDESYYEGVLIYK